MADKKNVFVFGADDFNLAQMKAVDLYDEYSFHRLFEKSEVKAWPVIPARKLHEGALDQLHDFERPVDAIVGYWDFPVSTMLPLLRKPFSLPSPTFEAVLKCEHKYWSRLEQQKVVPDYIPPFCSVDPFAPDFKSQITIDYPFWIKPVKSASSYLGFKVRNDAELEDAIDATRANIHRFGEPFNYLLQFADLPKEIKDVNGFHCIVEGIISSGKQCTLEGYVYNGEVHVYGVVGSIRESKSRSSFSRYQYPSKLPKRIQEKMVKVTTDFLKHIDYDNGPFNIEFYWEKSSGQIWLLEINTRISKSHCPLFRDVDGVSHHQVMLDLALGRRPRFPHRKGDFKVAAKFMWREHSDALVTHIPTDEELDQFKKQFPSAEIELHIHEGMHLSDLVDQDSYTYEIAVIFLGAQTQKELLKKYRSIQQALPIGLRKSNSIAHNLLPVHE